MSPRARALALANRAISLVVIPPAILHRARRDDELPREIEIFRWENNVSSSSALPLPDLFYTYLIVDELPLACKVVAFKWRHSAET